jgi:hypothetical protein
LITDFLGSGKYAINIESIILSSLTNVNMQECANGIFFNGGAYATISTSTVLNNCYANNIAGKGYHVYRSNYITFNSCAADDVGTAYYMDEALGITFNSCGAEWASSVAPNTGWHTLNSSLGVVLNGCYTYANRGYSINIAADTTAVINGFVEDSPSSATASLLVGAGASATESECYFATARSVNASGVNIILDNVLPKTGGTMSGNITLGENTGVALDPAGSADEKWSGITCTGTAGATLAVGDLVYLDVTATEWLLADADAATTSGDVPLGLCILAANDGQATNILLMGTMRSAAFPASIALGAPVYVSTTAGDIQAAQPSGTDDVIRRVGWAITAEPNTIYFNPSNDYITHT